MAVLMPRILDRFSLDGRVALITGSSRGIGWATAQALAAAGALVVLNGRDLAVLNERAETLRAAGQRADIAGFDVGNADRAAEAAAHLLERHGQIDVLVSNAGGPFRHSLADTSLADWRDTIESHLTTAFALARAVAPGMIAQGWGRIILMSSVMGAVSRPNNTAYSAAKGGLNALVRALAAELGPSGVTCNAIAPGWIATDATEKLARDPEWNAFITGRNALKRWGQPEEIAAAALFLAADAGAFVTGHILTVDGGLSATL